MNEKKTTWILDFARLSAGEVEMLCCTRGCFSVRGKKCSKRKHMSHHDHRITK